ncbi:hypothetical protein [Actimicrobium sp. GrIS 1.19]|uniref:hypothetical protein n=1 Tax=Actimicrobium sp. GrIS 1.19 TaxID=3071708 RepID=UPI002E0E6009
MAEAMAQIAIETPSIVDAPLSAFSQQVGSNLTRSIERRPHQSMASNGRNWLAEKDTNFFGLEPESWMRECSSNRGAKYS